MEVRGMQVVEAQLISEDEPSPPQFIRIEAELDLSGGPKTRVSLWTADADGSRKANRPFATATVLYFLNAGPKWRAEWQTASHLVSSRTDALWASAASPHGKASALSRWATYQLFANVVDYDPRYQAIQRAALDSDALEAAADVVLDGPDRHGTFQLAGLVMNSFGDVAAGASTRDVFFITPGWRQLRIAETLEAGVMYRNYVRMVPVEGEPGAYAGDIYLLRDKVIVGICEGIKFKRVSRALMPIMFPRRVAKRLSAGGSPDSPNPKAPPAQVSPTPKPTPSAPAADMRATSTVAEADPHVRSAADTTAKADSKPPQDRPHVATAMRPIAQETGLDTGDLRPETVFTDLGVDSLMSLALADKMQAELGICVKSSLFLECATVGELHVVS